MCVSEPVSRRPHRLVTSPTLSARKCREEVPWESRSRQMRDNCRDEKRFGRWHHLRSSGLLSRRCRRVTRNPIRKGRKAYKVFLFIERLVTYNATIISQNYLTFLVCRFRSPALAIKESQRKIDVMHAWVTSEPKSSRLWTNRIIRVSFLLSVKAVPQLLYFFLSTWDRSEVNP